MISPDQIEAWIKESQERPWSSELLIRHIANRLNDITRWNEELQAENIALRSEKQVAEYERQIASLEYQLDLLKRQVGNTALHELQEERQQVDALNLLVYNSIGQVHRFEFAPNNLESGQILASVIGDMHRSMIRMLVVSSTEEILFAFDTGRVLMMPVVDIPLAVSSNDANGSSDSPPQYDWEQAYQQLPIGSEELVQLLPIARLPLYDSVVQVSRRACVKRIKEALFENYLSKAYIGTGARLQVDRMFGLNLCTADDSVVLVSQEGFLSRVDVASLPMTMEEPLRLSVTDHIVSSFPVGDKPSMLVVTNNGKVIYREESWLPIGDQKVKGYAAFSSSRRNAGVRVAGAVAVSEDDWGAALMADGRLTVLRVADLMSQGAVDGHNDDVQVVAFAAWEA